jgi:aspartate/methionine/tyrosine aminotransferase
MEFKIDATSNNARACTIVTAHSTIETPVFMPVGTQATVKAIAALNNSEEWHNEMNINLYKNRRHLAEEIMKSLGCSFDPHQVGMFLWGKIPDQYKDSAELADKVLYDAKVFITPGFIFGNKGQRYVRLSLCANEKMLGEALERIKAM